MTMNTLDYSYIPHFLIFHFLFAHVFTSSRILKNYWKLDHNVNPREDIIKYGEISVKKGKINERQLKLLKRNEACHQNLIENYPILAISFLFAAQQEVQRRWVNQLGLWLILIKMIYSISYIAIESHKLSYIRSLSWWIGNFICASLVIAAGRKMNI